MDASQSSRDQTLTLIRSCQLDPFLTIKLGSLTGKLLLHSNSHSQSRQDQHHHDEPAPLQLTIGLSSDNKQLIQPIKTANKLFKLNSQSQHPIPLYDWNTHVQLPIRTRDIPLNAQLTVTIHSNSNNNNINVIAGSTMRLYGKKATLKKGKQRLFMHRGKHADPSAQSDTPSKVKLTSSATEGNEEQDEMGRLEKLVKKQERGDVVRLDWLDKLAWRELERVHAKEEAKSKNLFFYLDMPKFDFPVVFSELEYPPPTLSPPHPSLPLLPSPSSTTTTTSNISTSSSSLGESSSLFTILDPEISRENPVEAKHRRLVRSHRKGPLNRELKPNAKIRDELNDILRHPPTHLLSSSQRDLLWQFRFYLTRDKRALTKFLKSVMWTDPSEVQQAVEVLLPMWAEVDMDDALELLGPQREFADKRVRAYAVERLGKADDEELMLYLLQLVQALKFSPSNSSSLSSNNSNNTNNTTSPSSSTIRSRHLAQSQAHSAHNNHPDLPTLEDFLVERSALNSVLGNCFFWYLKVEIGAEGGAGVGRPGASQGKGEEEALGLWERVMRRFERRVEEIDPTRHSLLQRQATFIARLSTLAKDLRLSKDGRPKKIDKLRSSLSDTRLLLPSLPLPLPLDASRTIVSLDPEKSSVFKSNLFPLRLHFICDDGSPYPVIFKNGDDLRQDQLVIQLFTLMDLLLRKENLDLKLMPYKVLATGPVDGMVQFVESKTLQDIISSGEFGGGLLGYLRKENEDPGSVGTYGVKPEVLDTYVRSCAGYCVVTYLLGVGDRHLDNLLLSPDGHFFHVDFGYILGRDPKPFPPAVKVCKEMVDAMGGMHSPHYARFKSLCYTGFTSLRKNANLILNLVALMVDGNIPDIKLEPDKAVSKVQDKFLLGLSEEEAIKAFESLLNDTSYFTSVLDRIHSVAQYWRS
ncbi:phosphatidylinositol 3-kinase [Meredithblackwellia eburnea MCA 4105]